MAKRYVNVKIPQELADEIDAIVEAGHLGYRSRAELVIESSRERVIKIWEMKHKVESSP